MDGLAWSVGEGGLEAVAALTAIEPVFERGVGKDLAWKGPGASGVLSSLDDAAFALLVGEISAASPHDLASLPAAGQIVGGGFGTDVVAVGVDPLECIETR